MGNQGYRVNIENSMGNTLDQDVISANDSDGVYINSGVANMITNCQIGAQRRRNHRIGEQCLRGANLQLAEQRPAGRRDLGERLGRGPHHGHFCVRKYIELQRDRHGFFRDEQARFPEGGVLIDGGANLNTIGSGNVVSGNTDSGVTIDGSGTESEPGGWEFHRHGQRRVRQHPQRGRRREHHRRRSPTSSAAPAATATSSSTTTTMA